MKSTRAQERKVFRFIHVVRKHFSSLLKRKFFIRHDNVSILRKQNAAPRTLYLFQPFTHYYSSFISLVTSYILTSFFPAHLYLLIFSFYVHCIALPFGAATSPSFALSRSWLSLSSFPALVYRGRDSSCFPVRKRTSFFFL